MNTLLATNDTDARTAAIDAVRRAASPEGFVASAADDHYWSVWARDASITALGAEQSGENDLIAAAITSLKTLANAQRKNGQIPCTVWSREDGLYRDFHENGAVDAAGWFAVATAFVRRHANDADRALLDTAAARAIQWLRYLDINGMGPVWVPPAGDWMDSTLHRSGRTLVVNSLYVWALRLWEPLAIDLGVDLGFGPDADTLAAAVRALLWPTPDVDLATLLWESPEAVRKDWPHPILQIAVRGAARDDRRTFAATCQAAQLREDVDVLGNCLAILSGVATPEQAALIADALADLEVSAHFASRTLAAPSDPTDPTGLVDVVGEGTQDPRWQNPAWSYHNAGAWPFVGGFHAWALRHIGRDSEAQAVTQVIDQTNTIDGSWAFPEWVNGETGEPCETLLQAWSAAGRLYADRADASPRG